MQGAFSCASRSPEETRTAGAALAAMVLPRDTVTLSGELGAGKTVFVQGLAAALGVRRRVTSPTFTIVHEYEGRYPIIHLDLYRLDSFQEVLDLGLDELLDTRAIRVVEWGQAVVPLLPQGHLDVEIVRVPQEDDARKLVFRARGKEWARRLEALRATVERLLGTAFPGEGSNRGLGDSP